MPPSSVPVQAVGNKSGFRGLGRSKKGTDGKEEPLEMTTDKDISPKTGHTLHRHLDWTPKYLYMTRLKLNQPLSSRVLPARRKPHATERARRRMGWIGIAPPHKQTAQQEFCEDWQGAVSVDPDAIELGLHPRTASSTAEGLSLVGFEVMQSGFVC